MKRCCHCKESKPLDQFKRAKNRKDGLYPECKACCKKRYLANAEKNKAYSRAYYQEHREQALATAAAYKQTARWRQLYEARRAKPETKEREAARMRARRAAMGPEKRRELERAYYASNRERLVPYHRQRNAEWRKANPEQMRANNANWRAKNRVLDRNRSNLRRAMIAAAAGHFTGAEWAALKAQYAHTCLCCGRREPEIKLTADHVVPLTKGGSNYITNIQPLCHSCNASKGNRATTDYRPQQAA